MAESFDLKKKDMVLRNGSVDMAHLNVGMTLHGHSGLKIAKKMQKRIR